MAAAAPASPVQIPVFIGMPTIELVAPVTDCQFE